MGFKGGTIARKRFIDHVSEEIDDRFVDLVNLDYESMMQAEDLAITKRAKELLLMQSIQGRAMMGHGNFREHTTKQVSVSGPAFTRKTESLENFIHVYKYPNVTIEDVIAALVGKERVANIRQERQEYINGVKYWDKLARTELLDKKSKGKPLQYSVYLKDQKGQPLCGIQLCNDAMVNPQEVRRGLVFGSCMDTFDPWRLKVREKYGLEMGGGSVLPFNIELYMEYHKSDPKKYPNIDELANRENTSEFIDELKRIRVVPRRTKVKANGKHRQVYLRGKKGLGVSDDAAIIAGGLLYNKNFALGVLLADAIDTWDKCTPMTTVGGQDEEIGEYTRNTFVGPAPNDDEIVDFIHCAAIDPEKHKSYPDCSQRRLLKKVSIEDSYQNALPGCYAVQLYMQFIELVRENQYDTDLLPRLKLSITEVRSEKFFKTFMDRMERISPGLYDERAA